MFSCEYCQIFKSNFFPQNTSGGCFWRYLSESSIVNCGDWILKLKKQCPDSAFCWMLLLLVKIEIDAATFEVIMANFSQDITRNQFLWKLMVPPHKQTLSCNTYGKKKGLLLFSPLPPPSLISFPPVFSFFFILTPYLIKQ